MRGGSQFLGDARFGITRRQTAKKKKGGPIFRAAPFFYGQYAAARLPLRKEIDKVGNVEHAERPALRVEDGQLADLARGNERQRFGHIRARADDARIARHGVANRTVEEVVPAALEKFGKIAVGKDSGKASVGVDEQNRARTPARLAA